MKLTQGLQILNGLNIDRKLNKKILMANTDNKSLTRKELNKSVAIPSDPIYFTNASSNSIYFNPDIRYRNTYGFSPLTGINYRNELLIFAENHEIKEVVEIMANECVIIEDESSKYSVKPSINMTQVTDDKLEIANAIQEYLDNVFFPKLWFYYNFDDEGLIRKIEEYLITGKICYEIIYDSLKNPKNIVGLLEIDPSTIQKMKHGDFVYYVQRPIMGGQPRVLHENQVILIEHNEYDYGYISFVDKLRMPFNIMRSMMTSKVLWFAAKSQVRMHIKLNLGDVSRTEALEKLTKTKNQYINQYSLDKSSGEVMFNNEPNNSGYREFFTAETAASGAPEIEEVIGNGPDLTEVDSLQFWEKLFYKQTGVPYDRIDPNSSDSWGFTDVNSMRKIEINFGKKINKIRTKLNQLFIKPIIIQLTLQQVELGTDLTILDMIKMNWSAFNEYEQLAMLEVLNKKVELAQNISTFGETEDANGVTRKAIPTKWIIETYLDLTQEQLKSMDDARRRENLALGFNEDGTNPNEDEDEDDDYSDEADNEDDNDSASSIRDYEDDEW